MQKIICLLITLSFTFSNYSQAELNAYKAVIIPYKFSFSSVENEYRLNTTLRHLLKEKGFEVYFDNELLSKNIMLDRCSLLFTDVILKETLFKTEMSVMFNDCNKNLIYKTQDAASKAKDYNKAYNEALQETFKSLDGYTYFYDGTVKSEVSVQDFDKKEFHNDDTHHSKSYSYNDQNYTLDLITNTKSAIWGYIKKNQQQMGIINKSLKNNFFHVYFEKSWSLGYFDTEGNFIIESSDLLGNINIKTFKLN